MYNVNGFLRLPSRRGRLQMLDLRAPEDRLIGDDDVSNVRRSPVVSDWIDAYHAADEEDDEQGRVDALMKVIDANRADMAASGVPVFAHSPLPDDFAAELAHGQSRSGFTDLLAKFDPSVRRLVAQQLEQGPTGGGRYALLGGEEEDGRGGARGSSPRGSRGQGPGTPPTPREKPPVPGPVMPRPHPDSEQREQERKQKCQSLKQEHADLRRTINYYEGLKKTAEFRLNVHRQNRANLLRLLADVEGRLNEARSRSTDPGDYYFVCPGDRGSRKGPPGKGRRGDWIRDGLCEVLGPIVGEQAKERERRRLEDEKARDIRNLQAEHSQLKQKIAEIDQGMKDEQSVIDDAKDALHWHYLKLSEISDNYKTSCGNPRELWPY